MSRGLTISAVIVLVLAAPGCSQWNPNEGIMKAAPGDPAGSASIGTGSVTMLGGVPPEAKAAGIGLGP